MYCTRTMLAFWLLLYGRNQTSTKLSRKHWLKLSENTNAITYCIHNTVFLVASEWTNESSRSSRGNNYQLVANAEL